MSKFIVADTSKQKGVTKVRFANDMLRIKVLEKNGHTNVDLTELMTPMTKQEIAAYLLKIDFAKGDAEKKAAIEAELDKRTEKPAKAKVTAPKEIVRAHV